MSRIWIRGLLLEAVLFGVAGLAAFAAPSNVTFNKDVLPVLQKNCQVCHRPGEIGPMSFLSYESTRPWAKSIKSAVLNKKMPPWFADPQYGHFMDDRRLSDADLQTLVAWVDAGAPEGDPKDKPAPMVFRDGWNIQPDVVFQMPQPYHVPARGEIQYTYIVIPTNFTKDTWVTAGEIRPGNRSVLHHVVANIRPPGSLWMKDAQPGVPYVFGKRKSFADSEGPGREHSFMVGYVPGMQPQRFDVDQSAMLIPAGSDIVFELHYTTNGTATDDQTKVGLTLAKEPPLKQFVSIGAQADEFTIAPGDADAPGHAQITFNQPVELTHIQPHMHLRGKDMKFNLIFPTGESQTVLNVPHYDFNWQIVYYFDKPMPLPKGTKLDVTGHWDNSANNKYNPDPTATVRWGEQSWEEMFGGPMAVIVDRNIDPKSIMAMPAKTVAKAAE